ncbi:MULTISPECIES: class I SAM-dependent methyltransferase [Kaistia]|uniref:Class I SAM-dependent methyltransferase n=1 Tax=Kaistia nematophila TaxID=2994654 RepID=A0A9X3E8J9_9HYPH|nr:class I SAM-dependent methyltransferase [Kaistia nematophila]MCX5568735.1 class I SAM-dependent methyltransferase [Kaistia nematophila]
MTAAVTVLKSVGDAPLRPDFDETRLAWLMQGVQANRFLPEPTIDSIFVGDGDYRAIGSEFLGHLVRLGGLLPDDRVLDIGSGIGRIAVPLTQYLTPAGAYWGVDPVADGVAWCKQHITPVYDNFRFDHIDVAHHIYNPKGAIKGEALRLSFEPESFEFIFMVSVATHLPPREIAAYIREARRLLVPGGRLFITAFILDEVAQRALPQRDPRLAFKREGEGPAWLVDRTAPLSAVGFDDGFFERVIQGLGLSLCLKSLGHWRGQKAAHYQDILVVEKKG